MESLLPLAFTSGWASGLNAYLVVLLLGIFDRISPTEQIPDVLASWPVLIAAGIFFVMEFVADKIPLIDSSWDAISTVVRPAIGAILGVLMADTLGTTVTSTGTVETDVDALTKAVLGSVGGGTALLSHIVKSSARLAVNTSPEPASNVAMSVAEDTAVFGLMWFVTQYPYVAAGIAGLFLITGFVAVYAFAKVIGRGLTRVRSFVRRSEVPRANNPAS